MSMHSGSGCLADYVLEMGGVCSLLRSYKLPQKVQAGPTWSVKCCSACTGHVTLQVRLTFSSFSLLQCLAV
jgi:hypothetical protein